MQPTYLPYLGYFRLIRDSDLFVFLDDVQFERRSWQQRNRILGPHGIKMLTVPVRHAPQATLIKDIQLAEPERTAEEHKAALRLAYEGRPFASENLVFSDRMMKPTPGLADLNISIIGAAKRLLDIDTPCLRSSKLQCGGKRSDRLLQICRRLGADQYLSTPGSADYLAADGVFAAAGVPVEFMDWKPQPYGQGHPEFVPYMCFLDAVANVGWKGARALIDA